MFKNYLLMLFQDVQMDYELKFETHWSSNFSIIFGWQQSSNRMRRCFSPPNSFLFFCLFSRGSLKYLHLAGDLPLTPPCPQSPKPFKLVDFVLPPRCRNHIIKRNHVQTQKSSNSFYNIPKEWPFNLCLNSC